MSINDPDKETEKAKFILVSNLLDEDGETPTRYIEPEQLLVILDDIDDPGEGDFRPWRVEGYGHPRQFDAAALFGPKETMAELERLGLVPEFEKHMCGIAGGVRINSGFQKKWIQIRILGYQAFACVFVLFVNNPAQEYQSTQT